MADTYHNNTQNQDNDADFGLDLAMAIRALYKANNSAPGPAFKRKLTRAAAELEHAKKAYGIRVGISATLDRMEAKAEDRAT